LITPFPAAIPWTADRVAAVVLGAGFLVFLWFFFFGARKKSSKVAVQAGGAGKPAEQEATIVVAGGYDPELVEVRKDVPLTLVFDRRESSPCSDEVVIPEFGVRQSLAANAKTSIRVVPKRTGEFPFTCGMNMLHGTLRVVP
jgi:Cu+-exporting ATPase